MNSTTSTIEPINLPSWGRTYVCRLPEVVRKAFVECFGTLKTTRGKREARAKLIARSVVDSKSKSVFADSDWKAIARKPEAELSHIFKVACRVNQIQNIEL